MFDRRRFLQGAASITSTLPLIGLRAGDVDAGDTRIGDRAVVLVELNGGNDGLNTVVPYSDPAYYRLRPALAVARESVLQLTETLGLHPALKPLFPVWQAGELAVALGVGYQPPNRSHFRSIEIWNAGTDSDSLQDGWVARAFENAGSSLERQRSSLVADGIVLGGSGAVLSGKHMRSVVLRDPTQRFSARAPQSKPTATDTNPALDHILKVREELHDTASQIRAGLATSQDLGVDFPETPLGFQLAGAARIIAAGLAVPTFKVVHSGFDTHAGQRRQHARLLRELAEGLAAFRSAMQKSGAWDRVLVMTYAEFGRRVVENGSSGTDHGTAAPHFLLGGRVNGGLYGMQPSLADLDNGDLKPTLDFRCLYATVTRDWWSLPVATSALNAHRPLTGLV